MGLEITDKDVFLAFLESGKIIRKKTLEEINRVLYVKYRIFKKYSHTYKSNSGNETNWYCYTIIDENGLPTILKIGNFEITHIDNDRGCTNFFGRNVEIRDSLRNKSYSYESLQNNDLFLIEELVPLLEKLNRLGCWETYELSLNLEEINVSYKNLEDRYNKLYEEYEELKQTHKKLKSEINKILKKN